MHSDENPAFLETSCFFKFIGNIWKILSVKSKFKDNVVFISIVISKVLVGCYLCSILCVNSYSVP